MNYIAGLPLVCGSYVIDDTVDEAFVTSDEKAELLA